jgi:hypothetical protein
MGGPDGGPRGSRKHLSQPALREGQITPAELRGAPLSGGRQDARRVRLVKDFYSSLPDQRVIYLDITEEVFYPLNPVPGTEYTILDTTVPDSRAWIIDDVRFFALYREIPGPPTVYGLMPSGRIEWIEHFFFKIDNRVPVHMETRRQDQLFLGPPPSPVEGYFPFLNETIGALEANFSLIAIAGQRINAYWLNTQPNPYGVTTVGVRIRGWEMDVSILEEILQQQR